MSHKSQYSNQALFGSMLLAFAAYLGGVPAVAQNPGHQPAVCTGEITVKSSLVFEDQTAPEPVIKPKEFDPEHPVQWLANDAICPAEYAIYSVFSAYTSRSAPPENIPVTGHCCKLPAADIFLDEHQIAFDRCPEGYAAAGGTQRWDCRNCRNAMYCTKINTHRYQLSEPTPGMFWGFGGAAWQQDSRIFWREIPAGIRYGVGRFGFAAWATGGCIGFPFGSLLVEKISKSCEGLFFRQLQYRGLPGDPPQGTPVQMYPDCEDISDEFAANPLCLGAAQ